VPISYKIDSTRRIVFATPQGTFTSDDLLGYLRDVWSRSDLKGFSEVVDMREVERVEYGSPWKVREMAGAAAEMDEPGVATRLAIVAESDHHFGLARMYQGFREANQKSMREVQVFRKMDEALRWLEVPGP
jgi:hypothetical protein